MSHPRLTRLEKFRNRKKDYKSDNESFIARGTHLNKIVDKINELVDEHAEYYSGPLTDGNPTTAEIEAVLGVTAEEAGEGFTAYIKDTTGAGAVFLVVTDGSSWYFEGLGAAL